MKDARILLTGYPGFLAGEIFDFFSQSGAKVDTIGLAGKHGESNSSGGIHSVCDLSRDIPTLPAVHYDLVIHAAGKAHVVPKTEAEARQFFEVNVDGTKNLLTALESNRPSGLIFISSVAVYGREFGDRISEDAPLNASDPYGKSKIEAERLILAFHPDEIVCGVVRLPLIAGANAPGNLGSMFRAMEKGYYFNIGRGLTRRSVILRSDVPKALSLLEKHGGVYNITDGRDLSFAELYQGIQVLTKCRRRPSLPAWIAILMALAGESLQAVFRRSMPFNLKRYRQMTRSLTFDGTKAVRELGFSPNSVLDTCRN